MAKSAANLKFAKPVSNNALAGRDLPQRIKILGWGRNQTLDGEVILDDSSVACFYENQKKIGRTTAPLDFNHNTVQGTKAYAADKEPRAIAGYGVPTLVPGDGLYLEFMQWTPSGRKSAKDYKDLSPTVFTDKDGVVLALHSCALTPAGQIDGLEFFSAESLHLYSADSVPELAAKCALKSLSYDADDDGDGDDDDDDAKDVQAHANASDDHLSKYGDVEYADPKNHKYPINTEAHVRAAWSYIHMPKNHKGYTSDEISEIKHRISAKAKKLGIEIKANSADDHVQVNAYATDPYTGIDAMLNEHLEHFRKALGMDEKATPDDIMKKLRATWEGLQADKQPLPKETPGSSVDPTHMDNKPAGGSVAMSFSADDAKKLVEASVASAIQSLSAEIKPLKDQLASLSVQGEQAKKNAEKTQRQAIVARASQERKVIPLTADEIEATPVSILESMVAKLAPEVNTGSSKLRTLSADAKVSSVTSGGYERGAQVMTDYFSGLQVHHTGPSKLSAPTSN